MAPYRLRILVDIIWNKIQMPKLKLLYEVKMDLNILFATNTQIDVAHFCIVFPQQSFIPA